MPANIHIGFRSNPAILFTPLTNEPSPTAVVTFRSNPQIDLGASMASRLTEPVNFKSSPAIVFSSTASGRIGGGALLWKV